MFMDKKGLILKSTYNFDKVNVFDVDWCMFLFIHCREGVLSVNDLH